MKKLLVVVDMQNDFVDGVLGTKEAQSIVPNVVKKINEWDGDIIATRDTHHKETYMTSREGKHLPVPHCIEYADGWKIKDSVMKALTDHKNGKVFIIDKYTFGVFKIKDFVIRGDYKYVEFVGLCTDICVVSNAIILKNQCPELDVAVDGSCCAGVTPESHEAALLTMKMCQIDIF